MSNTEYIIFGFILGAIGGLLQLLWTREVPRARKSRRRHIKTK